MKPLRFIDLFAGLGGFHLAMKALGYNCVFACEIDENLAGLYDQNFGLRPHRDIRTLDISKVPPHDVLCAGFPCQPFSKAGGQEGLDCPQWGDLIDFVIKILRARKPRYFIIENVPNLVRHKQGETWKTIVHRLRLAGYGVRDGNLSPHQFGVPQIRERAFIVGERGGLNGFKFPRPLKNVRLSIRRVLDRKPSKAKPLPKQFLVYLRAWQKFVDRFPKGEELPSFPIWAMEFGATYPYEDKSPTGFGLTRLGAFRGSLGVPLRGLSRKEVLAALPPYARYREKTFPKWKIDFIRQNRELYMRHKRWIDKWLPAIKGFAPSFQKFEWNCKGEKRDVWKYVLQFRASGIRVKRPTTAPSLVAMTTSQVPVIAWQKRYMTIRECSRLQSMGELKHLPEAHGGAFKALGNAVNVDVVKQLGLHLLASSASTPPKQHRSAPAAISGR
ncbi:MAG: DNA (cytosine-5-)-methyltransferase [Acidobacteria bacterium]|nr:DNA (cytosine-5-)-methyltransferase [Acidobacteriota bacterium]